MWCGQGWPGQPYRPEDAGTVAGWFHFPAGIQAVVFTGTYEHAIDAKNRLAIPSEIRATIARAAAVGQDPIDLKAIGQALFVTLGEGALCLYTEQAFEKRAEELDRSEQDPDQLLNYERFFYSLSKRVELDKQGRIRLPDDLIEMAQLKSEVVLIGVKDHLEVRDRQTWKDFRDEMLRTQPGMLVNPRRAMKKTGSF